MKKQYHKEYSSCLGREMEWNHYGHAGPLCLVIPCQDGRFFEWEDRNMYRLFENEIDAGNVQFISCDTIDRESWSADWDTASRMQAQENWVSYIVYELIPSALRQAGRDENESVMVMGCSMGAFHAANFYFRFPWRFSKVLAMSGIYDMGRYFYDGHCDWNAYQNNPLGYLENMPADHEYMDQYRRTKALFVVGQGDWEYECLESTRMLADLSWRKNMQLEFQFWGYDTPHDWCSWEKQAAMYFPQVLHA